MRHVQYCYLLPHHLRCRMILIRFSTFKTVGQDRLDLLDSNARSTALIGVTCTNPNQRIKSEESQARADSLN